MGAPISIEVDRGLIMTIDALCNTCHDKVQVRDKSQAAVIPYNKHGWSMAFDVEHLGAEDDLMKAALDFIALLKKGEISKQCFFAPKNYFSPQGKCKDPH